MQLTRTAPAVGSLGDPPQYYMDILSPGPGGHWSLNLPVSLRDHEAELQALLGRVFQGRQNGDNLPLAQQMTINWCLSKTRKLGLPLQPPEIT